MMRGAHLALAVNNPKTTLLIATVKFSADTNKETPSEKGAAWVTAHAPPLVGRARTSITLNFSTGQPKWDDRVEPRSRHFPVR